MSRQSPPPRLPARTFAVRMMLAAAMIGWGHGRACAADQDEIDLERVPLEQLLTMEVYGASKFVQKVSDAPSAVAIVTAADIKAFGWRTLADALRTIRGMHVSDDRNYTYLGARGFLRPGDYNTRFLLLVDGYRTNDAVFDQAAVGNDFILDLDLIERIEYIPGTGSSIYGANAFFGVINIITKRGRDIGGTQVALDVGSFGMRQGRATYGRRDANGVELLLSASAYRRDGQDLYFPEFDTPQTNHGVAERLDYERVERAFLKMASGAFGITIGHVERTKGVPTASFSQAFNDPRSRTVDMQTFVDIGHHSQIATDLEFSARVHAARYAYYGDYAYDQPVARLLRDGADARWWGADMKWVSTRFDRHKLVFGAEYQHDYRRDQYNVATIVDTPPRQATQLDDHRHGHRIGVYLQDEFALREDLLLNAGLRHDHHSASGGVTNPRMALIYKPVPATAVKLIYGTAFRAPNAYEMYYEVPGEGGQKANQSLRAERIRTHELVLEHQFSSENRVTAQLFHSTVSSLISLTTVANKGRLTALRGDELLQFQNLDSVLTRGAALQFEHLWSNGARLRTSANLQRTVDRASGAELMNSPSLAGKFNLSVPLAHDAWRAGFEALYVGRRKTLDAEVGGYWLANLSLLSTRIAKGAELTVGVYNLFDRRYADPGSEEHVQDSIAQDGRTFRIKLAYGF